MAKRKKRLPSVPPTCVDDVLLAECLARIDDAMVADYAVLTLGRQKPSKKTAKSTINALMAFATLGWTYFHCKYSAPLKPKPESTSAAV